MAISATYKVYNGTTWEEYYFKTSASQVGVSSTRKFITSSTTINGVSFTLASTGDGASATIDGGDIANDVSGTHSILTAGEKINESLVALETAILAIPSEVLTPTNYATTLDSVYQGLSSKLTALANITTGGFVVYDTTTGLYGISSGDDNKLNVSSAKVNNKAMSNSNTSGITLYAGDINLSSANNTSVATELNTIWDIVEGITTSYAISYDETGTGVVNGDFNSSNNDITITFSTTQNPSSPEGSKIITTDNASIYLMTLKVGDNVFITELDKPDRWVSSISYEDDGQNWNWTVVFSKLETVKVDLTGYWNSTTHPTTLSGYGITDAGINNGVITLGSNTITPLTSASVVNGGNTASWGQSVIVGTVGGTNLTFTMPSQPTDTKNTAGNYIVNSTNLFLTGVATASTDTQASYATTRVNEYCYIGTDNCLYSNGKRTSNVSVGTTTPSNNKTGDIWIDTTA